MLLPHCYCCCAKHSFTGAVGSGDGPGDSVPARPTNLDTSRTSAYCASSRCGGGGSLDIFFFSANMTLFYLSLSGRGLDIDYNTVPNVLLNPSQYFNEVSECFHLNPLFLWTGLIISCNGNDFYINLLTNTCQWCCSVYKCLYNKCTHGPYGLLYSE